MIMHIYNRMYIYIYIYIWFIVTVTSLFMIVYRLDKIILSCNNLQIRLILYIVRKTLRCEKKSTYVKHTCRYISLCLTAELQDERILAIPYPFSYSVINNRRKTEFMQQKIKGNSIQ